MTFKNIGSNVIKIIGAFALIVFGWIFAMALLISFNGPGPSTSNYVIIAVVEIIILILVVKLISSLKGDNK